MKLHPLPDSPHLAQDKTHRLLLLSPRRDTERGLHSKQSQDVCRGKELQVGTLESSELKWGIAT